MDAAERSQSRIKLGATEIMYLCGVGLLFAGLWAWHGLPVALTVCGAAIMSTAVFNTWLMSKDGMNGAI